MEESRKGSGNSEGRKAKSGNVIQFERESEFTRYEGEQEPEKMKGTSMF